MQVALINYEKKMKKKLPSNVANFVQFPALATLKFLKSLAMLFVFSG